MIVGSVGKCNLAVGARALVGVSLAGHLGVELELDRGWVCCLELLFREPAWRVSSDRECVFSRVTISLRGMKELD